MTALEAAADAALARTRVGGQTEGTINGWVADPARIGAIYPLTDPAKGELMWDPAGFCNDGLEETFDKYREAEVKHGRVAMMATIGLVAQHYARFPGFETGGEVIPFPTGDGTNGLGAIFQTPADQGLAYLVLIAGFFELGFLKVPKPGEPGAALSGSKPGYYQDAVGCRSWIVDVDDATVKSYEIEHGRLAMFCFIGIISSEYATGYDAVEQWAHLGDGISKFNRMM